ncbi:hypothetical protein AKJ51_01940 [candidate division MSBL1 archaeon SCGC-AAA382A20]|uniref:Uroporphyrinogen decarboxylase (URO-D) domain-containing protein n=1 Tax=candidate division MSBL1 archaeon SCGC-AAA382A20 TaxID=1698280 RepID=A0A133VL06_9EURY|nr:hypothetical protein AKJ51_01940 [candidate division MSBL1 archaeon SCGC-AAA382A20]
MNNNTPKDRLMAHLEGEEVDRAPAFSAMGNFIWTSAEDMGLPFYEIFEEPESASEILRKPLELYGYENVSCPIDMNIVAEAFGATVSFYRDKDRDKVMYPTVSEEIVDSPEDYSTIEAPDVAEAGRIPYVIETIKKLKEKVGPDIPVCGWIMGPFVSSGQMGELSELYKATVKHPDAVHSLISEVTGFQIEYAKWMKEAGADFISLREPGASQDTLSRRMFEEFAQPYLTEILENIPGHTVLHICGLTDNIVDLMVECGPDGISVEQKNNLAENRETLDEEFEEHVNLYGGELGPYETLKNGSPGEIEKKVKKAYQDGADVPMPGCDVWPEAPLKNMEALVDSIKKYG